MNRKALWNEIKTKIETELKEAIAQRDAVIKAAQEQELKFKEWVKKENEKIMKLNNDIAKAEGGLHTWMNTKEDFLKNPETKEEVVEENKE